MSLSITSFSFFVFVAIVLIVYFLVPKHRWIVLCMASIFYYIYVSKGYVLPILISVISIWLGSIYINKNNSYTKENDSHNETSLMKTMYKKRNKIVLFITICVNISLLLFYKFDSSVILPLAISYYTLSGIGYIVDVYKGNEAEKNICKLALFLCFFPITTQGPIVRYKKMKLTLFIENSFDIHNIISGLTLVMWGSIKKLVIADRLFPLVNGVFSDYNTYSGGIVIVAVIGYMIELYCDFSGGIDVIRGCAEMFGINLPENFRQPYFSASVSEFWRRWHISLGNWFKDYVYMPLATSKINNSLYGKLKMKYGKKVARMITTSAITFIVWIFNGIWHGAGWKYIVFGSYMGILIAIENLNNTKKEIIGIKGKIINILEIAKTLVLIAIGWMLIRVESLVDFIHMNSALFLKSSTGLVANLKVFLSDMDCAVIVYGVTLLLIVELLQTKKSIRERICEARPIYKILFCVGMIFTWLVLAYDSGTGNRGFIYGQF